MPKRRLRSATSLILLLAMACDREMASLEARGPGGRVITEKVGRHPSTISRELLRKAATRSGLVGYGASTAQWKDELQARRPKAAKLVQNA